MRLLSAALLLSLVLLTACHPVLPPEALAAFSADHLSFADNLAAALQPAQPATSDSPFVILYPALKSAPAPSWLRPAVRVTYSVAAATFGQLPDDPTPSGAGILEYNVIAQNRRNVVFLSSVLNTQIEGTPPSPLTNKVEIPGVGEFWFSPQVLKDAESAQSENFQVTRLPVTIGETTYNVVRMQSNTQTAQTTGEEVWEFDTKTGILVFYRQALYNPNGSLQSGSTVSLLAERQLKLPWRNGTVPSWVKRGVKWQFNGGQALDVGVGQATPLPMASVGQVTGMGPLWSTHSQQIYVNGLKTGESTSATGAMQLFGGYWLPAEAITVLQTGAILDTDPLTGIQISVAEANSQRIVMSQAGSGFVTQLYYDASDGRLFGIYIEQHMTSGVLYTSLQAVQ